MLFRFPLETLLRVRAMQTRQEEVRLESLFHQLGVARQQREDLRSRRREFELALDADMRRGTQSEELHLAMTGRRGLLEADRRMAQAIAELESAWRQQQQKYKEAHQREEVLKSMRENQFALFQEEERRREQQLVDDLFQSRRERKES